MKSLRNYSLFEANSGDALISLDELIASLKSYKDELDASDKAHSCIAFFKDNFKKVCKNYPNLDPKIQKLTDEYFANIQKLESGISAATQLVIYKGMWSLAVIRDQLAKSSLKDEDLIFNISNIPSKSGAIRVHPFKHTDIDVVNNFFESIKNLAKVEIKQQKPGWLILFKPV